MPPGLQNAFCISTTINAVLSVSIVIASGSASIFISIALAPFHRLYATDFTSASCLRQFSVIFLAIFDINLVHMYHYVVVVDTVSIPEFHLDY